MNLKKAFGILFLIVSATKVHAQVEAQEDRLSYSLDYGKSKATGARFLQNILKLRVPLKSATKSHFIIGGELGTLDINHSQSVADSTSLTTVGILAGYEAVFSNRSRLSFTVEPLIASDFANLSGNDFRFRADVTYVPHTTHKLAFGFGIAYQYQFSGSQILPIIVPVWNISEKVKVSGAFPVRPRVEVKLDKRWSLGAGVNVNYSSYRLSGFNDRYIQYQTINYGITPKYRFTKHFELGAFLGFGSRSINIYNSSEKIPLRIYSWDLGGGSHEPSFEQKYKGVALNLTASFRFE